MSASILHAVNSSNVLKKLTVDANGKLNVTGGTQNVEVTHNDALGASPDSQKGMILAGYAGTPSVDANDGCLLACSTGGELKVTGTHLTTIAGAVSGTEMQVDIVTSALPSGAATSALQSTGNSSLSTIAGAVSGTEMQVDIVTSALPSGAATSANQTLTNVSHSLALGSSPTQTGVALIGYAGTPSVTANDGCLLACSTSGELKISATDLTTLSGVVKSDDSTYSNGSSGLINLVVRGDSLSSLCSQSGDYTILQVDKKGALWSRLRQESVASSQTISLDGVSSGSDASSSYIDLSNKNGKITFWGDFDPSGTDNQTQTGGTGWNNLWLSASTSDSGTYIRMGYNFEIVVDSNGRFGVTLDIEAPYIKINTTKDTTNIGDLPIYYSFKAHNV